MPFWWVPEYSGLTAGLGAPLPAASAAGRLQPAQFSLEHSSENIYSGRMAEQDRRVEVDSGRAAISTVTPTKHTCGPSLPLTWTNKALAPRPAAARGPVLLGNASSLPVFLSGREGGDL